MDQQLLIIIAVSAAVLVILLVVLVIAVRRRRREHRRLARRFGPEYHRTVDSEGRKAAEEDLHAREEEHQSFNPRELDETTRQTLRGRMAALQFRFADAPADVLLETQRVVIDALRARGYPAVEDRERALRLLSVDYPRETQSFRILLAGSYGNDLGRQHALFKLVKHALGAVAGLSWSLDDLRDDLRVEPAPAASQSTRVRPAPTASKPTPEKVPAASRGPESEGLPAAPGAPEHPAEESARTGPPPVTTAREEWRTAPDSG